MSDFRLKVFQSVAKNLSFTKAAQEMFLTQPAVTRHIHELETQFHTRLFERQGNRIELTRAGKMLLEQSEHILNAYKQMEYNMNLLQGECSGELKLGASTTIQQYVLPSILADFIRKFPEVDVTLLNGNSRFVESALQEHRIDLGLVEGIIRLPNLRYTTFVQDELVAVVSTRKRLASLPDEISLEQLAHLPLVLREQGSGTLDVIERSLLEHDMKLSQFHIVMQLGSTESIKRFLQNSDCMGIVSIRSIDKELSEGYLRVIEIPEMPMYREFSFVQCHGEDDGLSSTFMEFAVNAESSHNKKL